MIGTGDTLAAAFAIRANRLGVAVHAVRPEDVPATLCQIARGSGAGSIAVAGNVSGRDTLVAAATEQGLHLVAPMDLSPERRADLGVSIARMAVAETGSLVVHSSSVDRRVELCADVHVLIVAEADLCPTLDQALRLVREISAGGRSYVSLITGPSRSADIELQPAIGVHGPREVQVILVGEV
jgi:L-lactate utilization protein LutC